MEQLKKAVKEAENPPALLKTAKGVKARISSKPLEFEQSSMNSHNMYRSVHGAPPLVLDHALSQEARMYAHELADKGIVRRSSSTDGENLSLSCKRAGEKETGPDAVLMWYNEVCTPGYEFDGGQTAGNEHFRQVIWRNTKHFGIGRATFKKDGGECSVIVARYRPAMEDVGHSENLLKGSFDRQSYCNGLGSLIYFDDDNTAADYKSKAPQSDISQNTQDFRLEALNLVNEFRTIHDATPLMLDGKMSSEAENYATKLASLGTADKSRGADGESVSIDCNANMVETTGDQVVRKWYNEICNPGYSFKNDEYAAPDFSQMVWRSSKLFGIGKATSEQDGMLCTYVVARYGGQSKSDPEAQRDNVRRGSYDAAYCDSLGKVTIGVQNPRVESGSKRDVSSPRDSNHDKKLAMFPLASRSADYVIAHAHTLRKHAHGMRESAHRLRHARHRRTRSKVSIALDAAVSKRGSARALKSMNSSLHEQRNNSPAAGRPAATESAANRRFAQRRNTNSTTLRNTRSIDHNTEDERFQIQ